ncbi:MAG TPA: hypothetical protein VN520_33835 [Streptomyces sp.]|uniref:hypothetical protein n=1 Tax=Streptomyces sp. TaxID=1931 RepID=UPI002D02BD4F|nr:hypothetical protein [Streptomyces sp.]HWU11286.1 hypothetical protein [Streptomyces sp.]
MFDSTYTSTSPEEIRVIFDRLHPYLPPNLKKVEPHPSGFGLSFTFTPPFTGREEEPFKPVAAYDDPRLSYVSQTENEAEHLLRRQAGLVLDDVYQRAREQWRDAAYISDLRAAIHEAPALWKTYQHELKALGSAYDYLRTPEAAREWAPAVSRLIDAQDRTRTAATAFDREAAEIARVHERHLYADLGHTAALTAAGYPEAAEWPIAEADSYGQSHYSDWDTHPPLAEQIRRLIEQQDTHLAKIRRLSGTNTN